MFFCILGNTDEKKINELLNLGNKYLEDMDYESAVLTYDQAIAMDPKCSDAYMGKAQAQYAMGQYEDAIKTLEEGILKVDDSSQLEKFLQGIAGLMSDKVNDSVDDMHSEIQEKTLRLNYSWIVRFVDTKESEIQIEVLGDEGNGETPRRLGNRRHGGRGGGRRVYEREEDHRRHRNRQIGHRSRGRGNAGRPHCRRN